MRKLGRSAQRNIDSISIVAEQLGELCDDVTFVGGCIMGFLITDYAAPDVRFTIDVDCIINAITKPDYYNLTEKLRDKGFKESISGDHPVCRWICNGVLIDIVPTSENVLGFSNIWYEQAALNPIKIKLKRSNIKIINAPFFLATKLEAFKQRGNNDFLLSHDLEDIISLIDGRAEVINDVYKSEDNLKEYLSTELSQIINNKKFTQALPGHLNYASGSEDRTGIVFERIQSIINC